MVGRALRHRTDSSERPIGLGFGRAGGPLVAVVGLTGGAGTSTMAHALAREAARESRVPVLLTESESERAGLALLAGHASPLNLHELAHRVASGERATRAFIEPEPRLRLIASRPRCSQSAGGQEVAALLRDARTAHGLVVVDCGAVGRHTGDVIDAATHVVWTVPASPSAIERASVVLAANLFPANGSRREALLASAIHPGPRTGTRQLRHLAEGRYERLILVPHEVSLNGTPSPGLRSALTALGGLLREAR